MTPMTMRKETVFLIASLHPGKLAWNLKTAYFEGEIILQTFMFGFHINFQGCVFLFELPLIIKTTRKSSRMYAVACLKRLWFLQRICWISMAQRGDRYGTSLCSVNVPLFHRCIVSYLENVSNLEKGPIYWF